MCMHVVLGECSTVFSAVPLSITCQFLLQHALDVVLLCPCYNLNRPSA